MDFSAVLQYLQGLLGNKQQMQTSQFGSNLGLQQQQLAQQNDQFGKQLGQQGTEFNSNLALQQQIQDQANKLAQQNFGLTQEGQQFNEGLQNRMNVTPGSATWYQMQAFADPNSTQNMVAKKAVDAYKPFTPFDHLDAPLVSILPKNGVPEQSQWRLS